MIELHEDVQVRVQEWANRGSYFISRVGGLASRFTMEQTGVTMWLVAV